MNSFATLHRAIKAYVIIFVVWGLYRLVFRLPEEVEETFLKPIAFVGSVLLVERPKGVGMFFMDIWGHGNWLKAALLGGAFGLIYVAFYGISSILSFGRLELGSDVVGWAWLPFIGISLATALWEEWVFSGYMLKQFLSVFRGAWGARIATAALFALIHVPILVFWDRLPLPIVLFQLVLLFVLGIGNTVLMGLSKNLLGPILSHALWGVAIFLFR